jgi:uncharacterized YigZ family protein
MSYKIPSQTIRNEIEILKSRFITTVGYTPSREEATDFIKQIRTSMQDASHHVYAFRVGFGKTVTEGMSDDGEPSGTSGPPTLAVVRGSDIGDITLITTRYYGGKKLGTGGLVRAYTKSAQEALALLPITLQIPKCKLLLSIAYPLYDRVRYALKEYDVDIDSETFTDSIDIEITIVESQKADFVKSMTELSSGTIELIDIS